MGLPKLTPLELRIMETLWTRGACSVREIQEEFPEKDRPAYTTVQTTVYRLEKKKAVLISKRISNANIFEAAISRTQARSRLIDDLLKLFGGGTRPVMAHLIETGHLTLEDIRDAEKTLKEFSARNETIARKADAAK
jgi:BlaI family transcriptional regulator, penicillinase repressor